MIFKFNHSNQKIRSNACSIHPALQGLLTFASAQRFFKLQCAGKEVEILQLKISERDKVRKNALGHIGSEADAPYNHVARIVLETAMHLTHRITECLLNKTLKYNVQEGTGFAVVPHEIQTDMALRHVGWFF